MIERKKKVRLIQLTLLILGIIILYFVYYDGGSDQENKIISQSTEKIIEKQTLIDKKNEEGKFFDIEYTGLDLNGNRYLLKSKEAQLDRLKPEIVYMKTVEAVFYFKDSTNLYILANNGTYNNKSLDMVFENNVKADYLGSKLFAEKAEYSNSKNYLSIYDNVRINHIQGNLVADKLLFDITKQKLAITSFNDGKINANVKLNEKRF